MILISLLPALVFAGQIQLSSWAAAVTLMLGFDVLMTLPHTVALNDSSERTQEETVATKAITKGSKSTARGVLKSSSRSAGRSQPAMVATRIA